VSLGSGSRGGVGLRTKSAKHTILQVGNFFVPQLQVVLASWR